MAIFLGAVGVHEDQGISAGFAGGGAPDLRTIFFREQGGAMVIFQIAIGSFAFVDSTVSFSFLVIALILCYSFLTVSCCAWCRQWVGAGIFTGGGSPHQRGCLPGGRCLVFRRSCCGGGSYRRCILCSWGQG